MCVYIVGMSFELTCTCVWAHYNLAKIILAKFPNLFFWHAHAQTLAVLHCSWRLGWCCCYLRLLLLTAVVASVIAVAAAGVVVGAAGVAAAAAHALQ